ncbi:hypothetical protein BDB01DRAFT_786574 [Pilobolus umbonatus]|nr:hypothetical protein BDB01DRAFT_786574 [Pilobolus umbonatus]
MSNSYYTNILPTENYGGKIRSKSSHYSIDSLKKAIREQTILLEAADDGIHSDNQYPLDELKDRIAAIDTQLYDTNQATSTSEYVHMNKAQWWTRYQLNLRQLEDLSDEKEAITKEIGYLLGNTNKLQTEIKEESEKLHRAKLKAERLNTRTTSYDNMTEADRIRAKAQAMVAARLNKTNNRYYGNDITSHQESEKVNLITNDIRTIQEKIDGILVQELSIIDHDLMVGKKIVKDRQMFEQGFYVDDELAGFIDQLKGTDRYKHSAQRQWKEKKPSTVLPPPVPTSQRPGTPRSEADIKAAAYKRIQERKVVFDKPIRSYVSDGNSEDISTEEKLAQERMRQAEAEARARLEAMREKRIKLRKEAAEVDSRKKRAAAEAAAIAEAEMRKEKEIKQRLEEERLAKKRKEDEERVERERALLDEKLEKLKKEKEEQERKEEEMRKKREEEEMIAEEIRQKKAREAAEQAALEKRMRRLELARREKELEKVKLEELHRRQLWEESERRKAHQEESERSALREDTERKARQEEEEKQVQQEEIERQAYQEEKERIMSNNQDRHQTEQYNIQEESKEQSSERNDISNNTTDIPSINITDSTYAEDTVQTNTTAGTSGYGVDVEDEVNFSIIYRVKTLYEYQGIREDDLTFTANEILKAYPSKDTNSDWWYGTSLTTNNMGFFPRTYVEIIEKAFQVRTLYEFNKTRVDDLGFIPNEIISVQPFQDEKSDWWYGTNDETKESGYFPKTYVERITTPPSISIQTEESKSILTPATTMNNGLLSISENQSSRGLSAPNTPIMKKANLKNKKVELTKRRRAASTANSNTMSPTHIPVLSMPHSRNISENLELLTWASTMDSLELEAIPPEERKRQEALYELISTERTYLNDLQMIINLFYTDSGKYLTQDERDVVFSNIDDLLLCNTALLSDMESRQAERANVIDTLGDVFLKHADSLNCYSRYCRNQSYATKFLQKKREEDQWFEVFLKTAQGRPECRSLDLSHFLLEPVQRITRYPLLLRHILEVTPKQHPDYVLIRSALSKAEEVLSNVNEETRRFENEQKMSELSRIIDMEGAERLNIPGREYVMDGALFKAKSGRKLHGYLFNDILILTEPLKTLSAKGYLYTLYREPMPLEAVSVRQQQTMTLKSSFSGATSDDSTFQIVYGECIIGVRTALPAQKKQWINQIQHYSALRQYTS